MTQLLLTQIEGDTVLREATEDDHPSLLVLEGSAPHAGASLIQARANFFARTDAYPVSQVLVAEREGAVIGVECLALTEVRVGGVRSSVAWSNKNISAYFSRNRSCKNIRHTPVFQIYRIT